MPKFLLSVYKSAERDEFRDYHTKEGILRAFKSFKAMLES